MKKLRTAICCAIIFLCLPGIYLAARRLPLDREPIIAVKYSGWSGVLRIWAFEGWTGGDLAAAWINACAASFEKSHDGVYIEVKYVSESAIESLSKSGVRAPNMILFPPGLRTSADGLIPIDDLPVRASLQACGGGYAAPIALGGYAWAINDDASGVSIPADEPWRRWSMAQLGDPDAQSSEIEITPPGIDLGLTASATLDSPLTQFANRQLHATAITQRELARLLRLRDQGRGPDWRIQLGEQAWTDQVLYLGIVDGDEACTSLCREFLSHLLSCESQARLTKVNLFSVLDAPTGYSSGSAMEQLELGLLREGLQVSPAFYTN